MNNKIEQCKNCNQQFTIDPQDLKFYEKMSVPAPTFCPECRLQRRLAWRNERSLYRRKCDLCGKDSISMYHEKSPIKSHCGPCWWSDKWNPLDYAKEYDFSRPFFEQFRELMEAVPHQNTLVSYKTLVNSDYNNMNHYLKNCYWLFNSDYDENCLYGEEIEHTKDSVDITMIDHSQFVYQSVNCNKCNQVYFSQDCELSHNIWFSKNLTNCNDCFGCVNLKNQSYRIFNIQYPKEEYEKRLKEFNIGSHKNLLSLRNQFREFKLKFPHKYMHGRNNLNCSGDYIYYSKNVQDTYIATESEYCRYCMWLIVKSNKDCYDFTQFGENTQQVYESMTCGKNIQNIIGGVSVLEGHDIRYSIACWNNSAYLFGCIGLRAKKYCILNKQYSQDEYENLVSRIKEQMNVTPYIDKKGRIYTYGDFFPIELSHFAYNETTAYEYFPLSAEATAKAGYEWKAIDEKNYQIQIPHDELPDHINDAVEDVVNKIISCDHEGKCEEMCTTAFRILPYEFKFYKQHGIPLPRLCPNCRHYERLKERNPLKLFHHKCQCNTADNTYKNTAAHFHGDKPCPNEFETTYSFEQKEIIYCEKCYQQEVA